MGEGAGVLILEELEIALSRGATIIAELTGYGISADAHHITSPSPNGDGAYRAMSSALRDAQLQPNDIKYINAHATSTPTGDEIEAKAIEKLFHASGKDLFVSSTKGATGHLLGAAGAVEAAFTAFAVRDGLAPPTLNLISPIDANFSFVSENTATIKGLTHGLSNSFGFGGTNCSLIMSKYTT
jgi:3-oxoacyl-[acyl-carrier-protein] synthase II